MLSLASYEIFLCYLFILISDLKLFHESLINQKLWYLDLFTFVFSVSITGRRVAQKPEIHEDFPGNFTQVVGSEVLLECPIVVNDSFDPPEMLWIEVKLHTVRVPL